MLESLDVFSFRRVSLLDLPIELEPSRANVDGGRIDRLSLTAY
jgi:hypothetical protein